MNDSDKILLQRLGAMLGVAPGYVDQAGIEEAVLELATDMRRMRDTDRALRGATDALRGWHEWARSAIIAAGGYRGASVMNDHQLQFAVTTIIEAARAAPPPRPRNRKLKGAILGLLAREPGRYASEIRQSLGSGTTAEYRGLMTSLRRLRKLGVLRVERGDDEPMRYYLTDKTLAEIEANAGEQE